MLTDSETASFTISPVSDITNPPSLEPSTHQPFNAIPEDYHTDTRPISFKLSGEEIAQYESNPPKLMGRMYLPGKGEDVWEVIEVSFNKTGWSVVVVLEGNPARHKILLEDFLGMLKGGVLQGVEF